MTWDFKLQSNRFARCSPTQLESDKSSAFKIWDLISKTKKDAILFYSLTLFLLQKRHCRHLNNNNGLESTNFGWTLNGALWLRLAMAKVIFKTVFCWIKEKLKKYMERVWNNTKYILKFQTLVNLDMKDFSLETKQVHTW